jgi:1-deoxy-D-xylulose-5-phosphate reductoisomerase
MRKRVIIVGATGSIGRQTIDVIKSRPDLFEVAGLSAHRNEVGLRLESLLFPGASLCLSGSLSPIEGIDFVGPDGLDDLVTRVSADIVVNGAAGSGGLRPSLATLSCGKTLVLANKESVVMAWPLLDELSRNGGSKILPIDSEHAALFQLISKVGAEEIDELIITASGGAFRDRKLSELPFVKPDEAACHPNWSMGRKITIDSATMANKGLEVIEASRYFGFAAERVRVYIHPQSIVHSLVRTRDGNLYAQLSAPDMRVPIQNALTWPQYMPCPFGRLDLAGKNLEFREPEAERFPLLGLAYKALEAGEGATVAYNAADEVGVAAFEKERVAFTDIARIVERTLERGWPARVRELESIFKIDSEAREAAFAMVDEIESLSGRA